MSATATSGANDAHELPRRPGRAHRGLVGLQRHARAWGRPGTPARRRRSSPRPRRAPASAATSRSRPRGRARRARSPSARTGNAWPGSPKAPSRTLTAGLARTRPSRSPTHGCHSRAAVPLPPAGAVELLGGRAVRRPQPLAHVPARDHLRLGPLHQRAGDALAASATGARTRARRARSTAPVRVRNATVATSRPARTARRSPRVAAGSTGPPSPAAPPARPSPAAPTRGRSRRTTRASSVSAGSSPRS